MPEKCYECGRFISNKDFYAGNVELHLPYVQFWGGAEDPPEPVFIGPCCKRKEKE